ncbi:Phenylacetaldehyde dehydrogenase [Pseudomonas ogarae]|nr:Phenylacetaldehyde dehydrogenase [Pseudomonas ogarae]
MELHSLPVDCSIGGKALRMVPAIEASTMLDPAVPFGGKNPRG